MAAVDRGPADDAGRGIGSFRGANPRVITISLVLACTVYALAPLLSHEWSGTSPGGYALLAALSTVFVVTVGLCLWAAVGDQLPPGTKWLVVVGQYAAVGLWGVFGAEWSVLPAVAAGAALLVLPIFTGVGVIVVTTITSVFLALRDYGWGADMASSLTKSLIVVIVFVAIGTSLSLRRELAEAGRRTARLTLLAGQDRIYRDLHDVLGRSLTVIAVRSEIAYSSCPPEASVAAAEMRSVNALARETIADMRSIVRGTRHTGLNREILVARDLLAATDVAVEIDDTVEVLPAHVDEAFGWVVRECVTNILRHSHAVAVAISVTATEQEYRVVIEDDGESAATDSADPGVGIDGMRQRLLAIGGALIVERDGGRFRVSATAPQKRVT